MAVRNILRRDGDRVGYQETEVIATGVTGRTMRIPPLPAGKVIACRLIAGAGTGKFQDTMSSDDEVLADTAVWQDWYIGEQTGTVTESVSANVTAIRGVSVSGEITIQVVI